MKKAATPPATGAGSRKNAGAVLARPGTKVLSKVVAPKLYAARPGPGLVAAKPAIVPGQTKPR